MSVRFDLAVIGGGINGAGIARDAAGRGLGVLLVEKDDLAAHTSSASSKFVHGGLRYLEHFEFRLVAEALAERRILLASAGHLVRPMTFVLPHEPHLRPRWMIRAGLAFYDLFGARGAFARSRGVALDGGPYGAPLRSGLTRGFTYSDAAVDDARLVIANALAAAGLGASVRPRTRCVAARRARDAEGGYWTVRLRAADGTETTETARALVNAAGPWAQAFIEHELAGEPRGRLRLVKGSHIAVDRLYEGEHAYILQNADGRVIFLFPYGGSFTAIGTTDVPVADSDYTPVIGEDEIDYLLGAANRYLARPIDRAAIRNAWSGVRALYDDGAANPSAVTRDYRLMLDAEGAPLLSVFGGKLTTYRALAERAVDELRAFFPAMQPPWTHARALPGGDLRGRTIAALAASLADRYPVLDRRYVAALAARHGTRVPEVLGDAATLADLGEHYGADLYEREVVHFARHEWAHDAEDVLWRRTKAGLVLGAAERARVAERLALAREAAN